MRIAVVGDCVFDVSARPEGPLAAGTDVPAEIELLPGGQGANVAVRLARRGLRVRLITPLADDAAGRLLREQVAAHGVDIAVLHAERSGIVVAIVDGEGDRTMLSHRVPFPRGVTIRHELLRQLAGVDWVHVSGYALLDVTGGDTVAAAIAALPASVVRSVDTDSLPPDGESVGRFAERLRTSGAGLVFAGHREASALLGARPLGPRERGPRAPAEAPSAEAPLSELAERVAGEFRLAAIVTGGVRGSSGRFGEETIEVPAYAPEAPALDSTGAGDAYAAAVIAELAPARWPPSADAARRAMQAGSELGSRVARVRGAQGVVLGEALPGEPPRRRPAR